MPEKFQRPAELAFPLTYRTFRARNKEGDEIVEYRVQDLLEEDFERAIELMAKYYSPEEPFSKCRGVPGDAEAFAEIQGFWRATLSDKLSIGCYKSDGSNELVGVNIFAVDVKDLKADFGVKSQKIRDVFELFGFISSHHDVFQAYDVDKYLFGFGLVVSGEYRGRNIAVEMLKARVPLLRALKMSVTSTVYTATGSQKAALRAHYEEVFSIRWSDIQHKFPSFDFSVAGGEFCKIIDLKI